MKHIFDNQDAGNPKKSSGTPDRDLAQLIIEVFVAILTIVFGGFSMTYASLRSRPVQKKNLKKQIIFPAVTLSLGLIGMGVVFRFTGIQMTYKILLVMPSMWLLGHGSTTIVFLLLAPRADKDRLTTQDIFDERPDFSSLYEIFNDPSRIPIGISSKGNLPVFLPIDQVLEHSSTSGATGQGKTTRLKTIIRHFIRHQRPLVIIDPKGEMSDVEEIRSICKEYGREHLFRLFSLSKKEDSAFYNALKLGDSQQLKSKVMHGLNLTHEYFGALADEFMSTILDAHTLLKRDITLYQMHRYIINPKALSDLQRDVQNMPESRGVVDVLEMLAAARKIEFKELKGLSAQLASLRAVGVVDILNPTEGKEELDLLSVFQNGGIAYFQMNINGYTAIAKAIGQLIVQDLKLVSNMFQSGQVKRQFDYAFVSIDEMGSFVYQDFADYIKQVRSAKIGHDLSFQGIADLRQISPEFAEQIVGNTVNKFIFRQDIAGDVETWSAMAGTKDTIVESFQTESSGLGVGQRTGMGNVHEGKTVLIDYDVFKKLTPGQAVFIDKKRHINAVISVWDGVIPSSRKSTTIQVAGSSTLSRYRRIAPKTPSK